MFYAFAQTGVFAWAWAPICLNSRSATYDTHSLLKKAHRETLCSKLKKMEWLFWIPENLAQLLTCPSWSILTNQKLDSLVHELKASSKKWKHSSQKVLLSMLRMIMEELDLIMLVDKDTFKLSKWLLFVELNSINRQKLSKSWWNKRTSMESTSFWLTKMVSLV